MRLCAIETVGRSAVTTSSIVSDSIAAARSGTAIEPPGPPTPLSEATAQARTAIARNRTPRTRRTTGRLMPPSLGARLPRSQSTRGLLTEDLLLLDLELGLGEHAPVA